jgi:hypothetical protein
MPLAHPVQTKSLDVGYLDGEAYEIRVHGHRIRVDQPAGLGDDSAQRIRPAAASGCSPYSAARTAA